MFTISRKKCLSGFTLIETIVAITVGVFVAVLFVGTILNGLEGIRNVKYRERLHANAIFMYDTVSYLIRQGVELEVPDEETLVVTLPDATTQTVTKNGSAVTLDGAPITSSDVEVENLSFQHLGQSVRIAFTILHPGSDKEFSATTTVANRNSF